MSAAFISTFAITIIKYSAYGLGIVLLFNVWIYFQQPDMIFFPDNKLVSTPKDWGLSYDEVKLTTADNVQLHGWYIPANNSTQALLFFHGNAGNISHRGDTIAIFHSLGLNILIIDYRGYGNSAGSMSETGAYLDAMAAWQYLVKGRNIQPENIFIFGRSLGGAVAAQLATRVQPKGLILESTFSSVKDMADTMMPVMSRLIYFRYRFNTADIIHQVKCPLLLIHSQDDEIVPYELGEKVFAAANSPKYFFALQGGHNDGFMQDLRGYKKALRWFIQKP